MCAVWVRLNDAFLRNIAIAYVNYHLEPIVFHVSILIASWQFLNLAQLWPGLMRHWAAVERRLPGYTCCLQRARPARRLKLVAFVLLVVSLSWVTKFVWVWISLSITGRAFFSSGTPAEHHFGGLLRLLPTKKRSRGILFAWRQCPVIRSVPLLQLAGLAGQDPECAAHLRLELHGHIPNDAGHGSQRDVGQAEPQPGAAGATGGLTN